MLEASALRDDLRRDDLVLKEAVAYAVRYTLAGTFRATGEWILDRFPYSETAASSPLVNTHRAQKGEDWHAECHPHSLKTHTVAPNHTQGLWTLFPQDLDSVA